MGSWRDKEKRVEKNLCVVSGAISFTQNVLQEKEQPMQAQGLPDRKEVRFKECEANLQQVQIACLLCVRHSAQQKRDTFFKIREDSHNLRNVKSTEKSKIQENSTTLVKSTVLEIPCCEIWIIEIPGSQRLVGNTLDEIMDMKMLCKLPDNVQM